MALPNLEIFNTTAHETWTEVLDQEVNKFNEASGNALTLTVAPFGGSFNTTSFFQRITGGLVRRRNPSLETSVTQKTLSNGLEVEVKVGAGSYPTRIDPAYFNWIKQSPDVAGVVIGRQLAKDSLADMLNTALGVTKAAMSGEAEITRDITGETAPADNVSFVELVRAQALLGDRAQDIICWALHSGPMHGLYVNALQNANNLFSFGTVKVLEDSFGRRFVISDSPALAESGPTTSYSILGLQANAARVSTNNDFTSTIQDVTGGENIQRTYQAEWSYNLGVKGFAYAGTQFPTDAALFSSANWNRVATSHKDLPGVLLTAHADI